LHCTLCLLVLPGVFELTSTYGIMTISFALFCIILGLGAANGRFKFLFIYPDRLLKLANRYVVLPALCE